MSKHFGKCALCGKECELTFEHIPPASAFNSSPARPVSGDDLVADDNRMPWETEGLPYVHQQKGMGKYSLCETCNNNTGSWYGDDYKRMVHAIHQMFLQEIPSNMGGVEVQGIYPLRFIKQVLSMFCSINDHEGSKHDDLREFILNKESVGIDKSKYKLCMYFTKSNLMKYSPLSVLVGFNKSPHTITVLSEITAYPLGFVLYFDPKETGDYEGIDITELADYSYADLADISFPLCIKEMNDIFPAHYRSKEEIKNCVEENKKWCEENKHE